MPPAPLPSHPTTPREGVGVSAGARSCLSLSAAGRRHLTASQKAIVFAKIAKLPHGGDYKSEKFDTEISVSIPTQDEAAKLLAT